MMMSSYLVSAEAIKGRCDMFGEIIATNWKAPNQKPFLLAEHKIQNVIF